MKEKLYEKIIIGLIASILILPVVLGFNHTSNNFGMPTGVVNPNPEL